MMNDRADERSLRDGADVTVKRRRVLAVAGAVVAGIVARQTSQPVAAAYSLQGDASNTANATTSIGPLAFLASTPILQVSNGFTTGFTATADAIQAAAIDNIAVGVRGLHYDKGDGIYGNSPHGAGVRGHTTDSYAVIGNGGAGIGVYGDTVGAGKPAMYGIGYATGSSGMTGRAMGASGIGVDGNCDTATGVGVRGTSNLGFGVYGSSNGNAGIFGTTTASGNAGLAGLVSTPGTAAFAGTSTNPGAFAGFFTGDVFVDGNFTVKNLSQKHGAIQHPGDPPGTLRTFYSVESPESWVEDFGAAQLVGGKADVTLDADFAAVIEGEYYVYLTPGGDSKGLYVASQDPKGFSVREQQGGTNTLRFSWRVVARPKTGAKAERMAKIVVPKIAVPRMPGQPVAPVPPPESPARPAASAVPQGNGTTPGSGGNPSPEPMPQPRSG